MFLIFRTYNIEIGRVNCGKSSYLRYSTAGRSKGKVSPRRRYQNGLPLATLAKIACSHRIFRWPITEKPLPDATEQWAWISLAACEFQIWRRDSAGSATVRQLPVPGDEFSDLLNSSIHLRSRDYFFLAVFIYAYDWRLDRQDTGEAERRNRGKIFAIKNQPDHVFFYLQEVKASENFRSLTSSASNGSHFLTRFVYVGKGAAKFMNPKIHFPIVL